MTFDQYGYLTPYEVIPTDFETFEQVFVKGFPNSNTRPTIFREYLTYLDRLRQIIDGEFYQWIDGSFVTNLLNPDDIDFITWVEIKTYEEKSKELGILRNLRFERKSRLDGYIMPYYPPLHRKEYLNDINRKQWLFDWADDDDKRPKGLIKIQF